METKIIDDMKVQKIDDEQYVVLPADADFFIGLDDDETPYEIVISHDGEQWTVGARSFPTDNIDDIQYDLMKSEETPDLYLSALPAIKRAFGDNEVWEAVEDGHQTVIRKDDIEVVALLRVGHGLPGHWTNVLGCAELTIRKTDKPTITERMYFSAHPDFIGEVTGEFFSSDGIIEDVGETWDIDHTDLVDPATLNDGNETNDDSMKAFIESYVSKIDFEDELVAAQSENFAREDII